MLEFQKSPMIHVCIGTKAQYIKTAPFLKEMDSVGQEYRLIDTGQHAAFSVGLRKELSVREPDIRLGGRDDVKTIRGAFAWAARLLLLIFRRRKLVEHVFGSHSGVCVIHGDTPSTLLAAGMARRAGLAVAHLEAGLRSGSVFNPFPEELIRIIVMRTSQVLFAPSPEARRNLERMNLKGDVVELSANSVVEAFEAAARIPLSAPRVVITCHRVENLHSRRRLRHLVKIATELSSTHAVVFVMHPATEAALGAQGIGRLESFVHVSALVSHGEFLSLLEAAPFVITDGGSVQEECAIIGVPTLLWRKRTERPDGIGRNVVLSGYDGKTIQEFIANHDSYRFPSKAITERPSTTVLKELRRRIS